MSRITQEEYLALQKRCDDMRNKAAVEGRFAPRGTAFAATELQEPKQPTPINSEADLHDSIIRYCKNNGLLYFHGAMGTRSHRTEGEPDFTIFLPGGKVLFVEVKTPVGKLSMEQQAVIMFAHKLGHTIHVVRSYKGFLSLFGYNDTPMSTSTTAQAVQPVTPFWNGQQYPTGAAVWAAHNRYKGLTATEISEVLRKQNADAMLDDIKALAQYKALSRPIGNLPRTEEEEKQHMRTCKRDFTEGQPE